MFLTDWMKDNGIGKLNFSNTPYKRNPIIFFNWRYHCNWISIRLFRISHAHVLVESFRKKRLPFNSLDRCVPIHELGHAIMCVLFRHKIVATQFFPTDTSQGALGYVQHQYNHKSVYQRLGTSLSASGLLFLVLPH